MSPKLRDAYVWFSRLGIAGRDRQTARYVMGENHYLGAAITLAVPFVVALFLISGGSLWPAAVTHVGILVAWILCLVIHVRGYLRTAAVASLVVPLIGFFVQSWFLSHRAGFMLPMLMASAVSFVTMGPAMMRWRIGLTAVSSAATAWTVISDRFAVPNLDASPEVVKGFFVANVALTTIVITSTAWLNDHYFTRERRRAESQLFSAQMQARTDILTQLVNRRGMVEALASVPRDRPYAIAVVDLDHFKDVNDTLGHVRGDAVLTEVARVLEGQVGPRGVVSRWGGEEFLVLMKDVDLTAAVSLIERARRQVEAGLGVPGVDTTVTFSAGLAAASAGLSWETTVRVADALLYEAKDGGRNLVRHAQVRADIGKWDS